MRLRRPSVRPRGGLSRRLMAGDTRQFTRWGFYATLVVTLHCGSAVMNPTSHPPVRDDRLLRAYNQMMARTQALLQANHDKSLAGLRRSLETAKAEAGAQGELSQNEADQLGNYLGRDLEDAGHYLASSSDEDLSGWFHFDVQLIETQLLDMFTAAADHPTLAYLQLAERARHAVESRAGEVPGNGTLQCATCGELQL